MGKIEIHPPEHGIHNRHDFLVHMVTIVLGILIAICLEQTVELIHHHDESRELLTRMRAESTHNLDLVGKDIANIRISFENLTALRAALVAALVAAPTDGDTIKLLKPQELPFTSTQWYLHTPTRTTWTVAAAAGQLALLPSHDADVLGRLDFSTQFESSAEAKYQEASDHLSNEERALGLKSLPFGTVALPKRDAEMLLRYTIESQQSAAELANDLAIDQGALQAVISRVHNLDEVYKIQQSAIDDNTKVIIDIMHKYNQQ